jgi:hypothetical protein
MNVDVPPEALEDGILQVSAGASLVVSTRLLQWDEVENKFKSTKSSNAFEQCWTEFNGTFGRAAMWNIFSTGAELMLKGVLIANGKLTVEKNKKVLNYPPDQDGEELDEWVYQCLQDKHGKCQTFSAKDYGTLGRAITEFRVWKGFSSPNDVVKSPKASEAAAYVVAAAYEVLRDTIRNRDTHAYVPDARNAHYWMVNGIFLSAFNTCLTYVESYRKEISKRVVENYPKPTVRNQIG